MKVIIDSKTFDIEEDSLPVDFFMIDDKQKINKHEHTFIRFNSYQFMSDSYKYSSKPISKIINDENLI